MAGLVRLHFAPAHPAHPLRSPQECAPPGHIPFLSFLPGAETEQSWPRSPGGSLRGRRPGAVLGLSPPGQAHLQAQVPRPQCRAALAMPSQSLPQRWPWTLSPRGAALVGVRLRRMQGGPMGDLPPSESFLSSRAHLVPGAGPLSTPATLAFLSLWAWRSPRARQGAKMSGQAGSHQGGGPSAAGVACPGAD